jgi:hypothetical protein
MSATDRQNRLLVAEDWKKIYQSFRSADFQSYDFENLRRTMVDYIRQNYPEDFNDYIESSEYLALLDVIAFLGQSVAFRVDLNARENFLELAERRDSILRLSQLVSYNAKRNIPAHGLLKFTSVQTTQDIYDSNGNSVSGQTVTWNDSSNPIWYDQFIKVINAALPTTQRFGNPVDSATIYNIPTEQYTFQSATADVPIYAFSKTVAGRSMNFQVTSTTFTGQDYIYEEPPKLGNRLSCVYRNDGHGYGSAGSGFFFNFTQGTLGHSQFTVDQPRSNDLINIGSTGINNTDVWLYRLDKNGNETEAWTQVPSLKGNNIIYNSINKNIKNIFGVSTRTNDAITLNFSDGTFGNMPYGTFKVYYRLSNGLSYTVNSKDIRNVSITIPYISNIGQQESLTISLALSSTITNAEASETNASIKANAPASYYTQNRMITGEDYNICPLSVSQQVLKVKAVNRSSSGISRYFDLVDPTGKYSSTNLFADDGVIYKDDYESYTKFSYINKTDIEGVIYNVVNNILTKSELRNFYYSKYTDFAKLGSNLQVGWRSVTSDVVSSTGYIYDLQHISEVYKVGPQYTVSDLKYITLGSLIKFVAPLGYYFNLDNQNKLEENINGNYAPNTSLYIWAAVVAIVNDGRANGTGVLSTGAGPITLNVDIADGAIISQIIPKCRTTLDLTVINTVIDLIFENKSFGLSYNAAQQVWQLVFESNIDSTSRFSLINQGSVTNTQKDASWMLLFTTDNEYYTITSRETRYIFESDSQIRFYFDSSEKVYDSRTNSVVRDKIKVLSINKQIASYNSYTTDFVWDVVSEYIGLDGYVDNKKIVVSFADSDDNGIADDPELFTNLVLYHQYILQEKYQISLGQEDYRYVANTGQVQPISEVVTVGETGTYYYVPGSNTATQASSTGVLEPTLNYKVYEGRANLKFQYIHNANYESRIDPGVSNIIDVHVLTKGYDTAFRQWINGAAIAKPLPPSADELYNTLSPSLNLIKSISDEVIYHAVNYKILFGATADSELQAVFKITKTPGQIISDNDIKSQVIVAINTFFNLDNWDFGDTFFFTELATFVMNQLAPKISNFVIVPRRQGLNFGSLFEVKSLSNQLLINGATVDDIEIISGITATNIKTSNVMSLDSTINRQSITSSTYGNI